MSELQHLTYLLFVFRSHDNLSKIVSEIPKLPLALSHPLHKYGVNMGREEKTFIPYAILDFCMMSWQPQKKEKQNKTKEAKQSSFGALTNQSSGNWTMLFLQKNLLSLVLKKNKTKNIAADHDKPTLSELNDAILTKEFSIVGVKKKTLPLIMRENQEY